MSGGTPDVTGAEPAWPRWVIVLSAAVALSTALPHLHQWLTPPPDAAFTGFVDAHNDQNLYLMWAEQVRRGDVMVRAYATAEEAPPLFVGPQWLLIGLIGRILPVALPVTYRIVAVILAFIYLLVLWRLVVRFYDSAAPRAFGFVVAALGSGFGALCDAANALAGRTVICSADVMPELWAYHSFRLPHFTMAIALMAGLALVLMRGYRRPSLRLHLAAAGLVAVLIAIHPYDLAVLAPVLVVHFAVCVLSRACDWRAALIDLSALAGAALPALLYVWQTHANPLVASWAEQNLLRSPHPLVYLLGFGVVLPLAVVGRIALGEEPRRRPAVWLLVVWVLITALVVYSYPLVPF